MLNTISDNSKLQLAPSIRYVNYDARLGCYFACATGRQNASILIDLQFSSHPAYASLDTKQLISHTRTAHVDTIASLQKSDRGDIPASEMHKSLTKIHYILDSAMCK